MMILLYRNECPWQKKCVYLSNKRVVGFGDLVGLGFAVGLEDDGDDDEDRGAADRERGDTGQDLHDARQDGDDTQEHSTGEGRAFDDVTQVFGGFFAGSDAWDVAAILLERVGNFVGVKDDSSIEIGKADYHNKVEEIVSERGGSKPSTKGGS